jgi:hypothetical protein
MTGGGVGKRVLFAVKSSTRNVADMITILSGFTGPVGSSRHFFSRNFETRDKTPMRTSVLTPLSWASSTTMTEYAERRKSDANSRRRTPSVMNLIAVSDEVVDEYRI